MSRPEVIPVCEYCGSRVCLKWSDMKCRHTGQTRSSYVPPAPEPEPEPEAVVEPEPAPVEPGPGLSRGRGRRR